VRQFLLDLYQIQKIDLSIRELEQQQQALPVALTQQEQRLATLTAEVAAVTGQRDATIAESRALQSSIEGERDKVRKWEARLNDIRNQREFQALQRETEGQKRATRDSEARLQELHRMQEELEGKLENLQVQLGDDGDACRKERARIDSLVGALNKKIEAQGSRRAELVPKLPNTLFRKYDTIRARRLGLGLSMVSAGCCVGCNMRLPPQLYNILQRGTSVEQCPSCARIIFWEQWLGDDEAPAAQA
jgi:predicted  nucleic acid-binding Zn-ribbon protein